MDSLPLSDWYSNITGSGGSSNVSYGLKLREIPVGHILLLPISLLIHLANSILGPSNQFLVIPSSCLSDQELGKCRQLGVLADYRGTDLMYHVHYVYRPIP